MAARKKTSKKLAKTAGKYLTMEIRQFYFDVDLSPSFVFKDIKALAASVLSQFETETKTKTKSKK